MDSQLSIVLSRNKLLKNVDLSKINFSNIRGKLFTISEGEILYREGDAADTIYLVISGEVNLLKKRMLGKPKSYIFRENDFLGHDEYFEETSRFSTAVALRDSYLIALSNDEIEDLKNQSEDIHKNLNQPSVEPEDDMIENISSPGKSEELARKQTAEDFKAPTISKTKEDDDFFKSIADTSRTDEPHLVQQIGGTIGQENFGSETEEPKFEEDAFLNEDGIPKAEVDLTQVDDFKLEEEIPIIEKREFGFDEKNFLNEDGIPKPEFELSETLPVEEEFKTQHNELDDVLFQTLNNFAANQTPEIKTESIQPDLKENIFVKRFSIPEEPEIKPEPTKEIPQKEKFEILHSEKELEMVFKPEAPKTAKGSLTDFDADAIFAETDEQISKLNKKTKPMVADPLFNEGTEMNNDQLNMIIRAAELVNSTIKIDEVLKNIVEVATGLTKADRGTLYLVDREKHELWSLIAMGNETKEIRLKLGEGLAGYVAKTGEVLNIKDAHRDPRFRSDFDRSSGYATKTVLTFPIQNNKEEIIGVLQLLNSDNGEFSKLDEELLKAVSIHAALALQNAEMVEKLLHSERIQSLGKMANFLIQDIKKPILVSKRYVEHLKSKVLPPDNAQIVDMLHEQLSQVADLVQTTSSYSEGKTILRTLNVSLNSTLADYASRIGAYVESRNCQIVAEYDKDVTLKLDVREFYQCYMYIVKNACDAMPEGGNIYISTKRDERENRVKIFFRDNGLGIADSLKEKIFEPFFTQGKKEGAGLGLSITKKVVEGHNGKIEVQSALGEGATFIITLPLAVAF